jgi:hypothetical protein
LISTAGRADENAELSFLDFERERIDRGDPVRIHLRDAVE